MLKDKISQEEKIDLIFKYLFESESHIKEEDFWNKLSEIDFSELKNIKDEDSISFEELKATV